MAEKKTLSPEARRRNALLLLFLVAVVFFILCAHGSTARFSAEKEPIDAIEWKGDMLACAAGNGVEVWKAGARLSSCTTFLVHPRIALDPKAEYLAASGWREGMRVTDVLDLREGRPKAAELRHEGSINDIAWNADGSLLAVVTSERVFLHERGAFGRSSTLSHGFTSPEIEWMPESRRFVLHDEDRALLYDVARDPAGIEELKVGGEIQRLSASPCGRYLAIADRRAEVVRIFDLDARVVTREIEDVFALGLLWSARPEHLAILDWRIHIYDTRSWTRSVRTLGLDTRLMAFDGEGSRIAAVGRPSTIEIWDVPDRPFVPYLVSRTAIFYVLVWCFVSVPLRMLWIVWRQQRRQARAADPAPSIEA